MAAAVVSGPQTNGPFQEGIITREMQDLLNTRVPQWSSSSGTALVKPDGTTLNTSKLLSQSGPTIVCVGDSTMVGNFNISTAGSNLSGQNTTVTVTIGGSHGLLAGMQIFISGANNSNFNGVYTVATIASSTVFTYIVPVSFGGSAVTDSAIAVAISADMRQQDRNFVAIAAANNNWNVDRIYQRCYIGLTTTYQLSRFSQDVLSLNPDLVIWMGFTNDIRADATFATITANITSMTQAALAVGTKVILCTSTPFDSGAANYNTTRLDTYNRVNNWIRQYASATYGVYLLDVFTLTTDATTATGNFLTNYSIADKVHLSDFGAYRVAVNSTRATMDLSTLLGVLYPNNKRYGVSSQRDDHNVTAVSTNYNVNPLMQGSAGTVLGTGSSGTAPNSYTVTNGNGPTTAWSVASRSDGLGNDLTATISAVGTGQITILGNDISASLAVGQVWQLAGHLVMTGIGSGSTSNLSYIKFHVEATIGGYSNNLADALGVTGNTPFWVDNVNGYFRSQPFTITQAMITAGVTLFHPRLDVNIAVPCSAVIKLGLLELRLRDVA